jgi:rubrerythrin
MGHLSAFSFAGTVILPLNGAVMKNKLTSIEMALHNELQECALYLQISKKMDSFVGREMFLLLAADEDKHLNELRKIHKGITVDGLWSDMVMPVMKTADIMESLLKIAVDADSISLISQADVASLKSAVNSEKWGYDFYHGLSLNADDVSEKEFFKLFASREWGHFLLLQEALLFHESTAAWLIKHGDLQSAGCYGLALRHIRRCGFRAPAAPQCNWTTSC